MKGNGINTVTHTLTPLSLYQFKVSSHAYYPCYPNTDNKYFVIIAACKLLHVSLYENIKIALVFLLNKV